MDKALTIAKVYGWINLVIGAFGLLVGLGHLYRFSTNANYSLSSTTMPVPIILISSLLGIIIGYGLIKAKLYAVYLLFIMAAILIFATFMKPSVNAAGAFFAVLLGTYFYLKRKAFN